LGGLRVNAIPRGRKLTNGEKNGTFGLLHPYSKVGSGLGSPAAPLRAEQAGLIP